MLVGTPDKILSKWLENKDHIVASDEGEAIGLACGYYYATGRRTIVFMSADGFCNALNPITSLVIPEKIEMNLVISSGRQEPQHKVMSDCLEDIIKALKYDPARIHITIYQPE